MIPVYRVNPYTVDMSKEAVCSNGLEMNDQHLVLGVYLSSTPIAQLLVLIRTLADRGLRTIRIGAHVLL